MAGEDVVFTAELSSLGSIRAPQWGSSQNAQLLGTLETEGHAKASRSNTVADAASTVGCSPHSRTRDPNFTRVGPCPVQVSRDVFVRSYDRALPRKADDFAQIATKFLSAARNVREERLSLRRGLVQTTLPAVTQDVVSTRVRNWTAA